MSRIRPPCRAERIRNEFGHLDVLVNNAAISNPKSVMGQILINPQAYLNRLVHPVHGSGARAADTFDQPLAVDGTDLV
jgi:NAD(P)-dependent dehydrogenase (short-subunit alcohol dehydrogenase family)